MRSIRCRARRIIACIGSMYGIYGNIYHQYTPNVSIYTIHPMGHETHETQSWVAQIACHPTASRKWRQKLWKQSPGKLAPPTVHPWPKRKKRNRGFPIDISTMCNWYQWIIYSLNHSYAILILICHRWCMNLYEPQQLLRVWDSRVTRNLLAAQLHNSSHWGPTAITRRSWRPMAKTCMKKAWEPLFPNDCSMIDPCFPHQNAKKHENCHEIGGTPLLKEPYFDVFREMMGNEMRLMHLQPVLLWCKRHHRFPRSIDFLLNKKLKNIKQGGFAVENGSWRTGPLKSPASLCAKLSKAAARSTAPGFPWGSLNTSLTKPLTLW